MKGSRALLLTLGITAGLVAIGIALQHQYARFLAEHWRSQLDTVPDERAAPLMEGVAQLGEPGIPVLVEALGSSRESVAGSGKRVLSREVRRWETLRAREYSPKLASLARALAERVEQFGPTARADAADLATQILGPWRLDEKVVDPSEVIACCEKVLRVTSPQRQLLADVRLQDQVGYTGPRGGPPPGGSPDWRPGLRRPGDISPETDVPLQGLAALPGGGLPIEALQVPSLGPERSDEPRLADAPLHEPRRLNSSGLPRPLQQPLRPLSEPDDPTTISERPAPPSDGPGPIDRPLLRPLGFLGDVPDAAGDRPGGRSASGELAGVDTVELMRRLQAPGDETAAAARAELAQRGFTETHLALARQMFHPNPEVRRGLARLLVELPNVDAVPWLLQLSRDADPEVRLSAIGLMATTGDPGLLEAIEAMGREDPDPRVQAQVERISRQRRGATGAH